MDYERIRWIDYAKGIGIILVIIGHVIRTETTENFIELRIIYNIIYSFHMALFFFLSGVNAGVEKKRKKYIEEICSKLKKLLIPWFCYSMLIYCAFFIVNQIGKGTMCFNDTDYKIIGLSDYFVEIVKGENPYCFHLWFLLVMFILQMLVITVYRLTEYMHIPERLVDIGLCFFSFLSMSLSLGGGIHTFLLLRQNAMFYVLGKLYMKNNIRIKNDIFLYIIGVIACGATIVYGLVKSGIISNFFGSETILYYFDYILGKPLIIIFIIEMVKRIKSSYKVELLGKESYNIYLLHQPLCSLAGIILLKILGISHLGVAIQMVICFAFSICIPILFARLINKFRIKTIFKILLNIR